MRRGPVRYVQAHWRGQLSLALTVLVNGLGLRLAVNAGLGALSAPPLARGLWLGLALADAALLAWQLTGVLRAGRAKLREAGDMIALWGSYAALVIIALTALMANLDRLANTWPPIGNPFVEPPMPQTHGDSALLRGKIGFHMYSGLQRLLETDPTIARLDIESDGGLIFAARGIARLAREHGLATYSGGDCLSACTLVFLAGADRHLGPGARLGFHSYSQRSYLDAVSPQAEQARDARQMRDMGISEAFIARLFVAAHDAMWFPSRDELRRAGVLTGG